MTLCSIYIPPSYPVGGNELDELISQLPPPFILIGDMNAHSNIWRNAQNNNKDNILEHLIEHNELWLWNDNTQTYISIQQLGHHLPYTCPCASHHNFLILSGMYMRISVAVTIFQHLFLHYNNKVALLNIPEWSFLKADWYIFKFKCSQGISRNTFKTIRENCYELFTSFHSRNNDTKILYSSKKIPQALVGWRMRGSS